LIDVRPSRAVGEPVPAPAAPASETRRRPWLVGLGIVLAGALALRLWGLRHGLPIPYNPDELSHFVPRAVGFHATGDFNPHYFVNPPGLTYVLYAAFAVRYLGSGGVTDAFAFDTGDVYLTARVVVAVIGTLSVGLLYLVGARLFDRRTGLLAATLLAVSFLAVSWSHQATNDVPASAAVVLSLLGSAGVLRRGRAADYALAGAGLGLACAMKYTAGIAILPLLAAAVLQRRGGGRVASGLVLAAAASLATFVLFNPFSVLAPSEFAQNLDDQFLAVSSDQPGKLGQAGENGVLYYLWALTWGLGWLPLLAAAAGAVLAVLRDRAAALFLLPAPVLYILFMGAQGSWFGRWLLPVLPVLCLLAAYAAGRLLELVTRGRSRIVAAAAAAVVVLALVGQSLVFDVHNDLVLSREGTLNETRSWMDENIPPSSTIFVDRVLSGPWLRDTEPASWRATRQPRWRTFPLARALAAAGLVPADFHRSDLTWDDRTRRLDPRVLDVLERRGVCWVVTGSTAFGRAYAEPDEAPTAVAFYEELARRGEVAYRASPYDPGAGPVSFNFDWVSNYYPLAYHRPGPETVVYRLNGGACAPSS
jgi:hypothetical protein